MYNLKGRLPADLTDLSYLQRLILRSNNLYGLIPVSYFSKPPVSWSYIDMGNNSLSGQLPSPLSKSIRYLDVSLNRINGSIPDSYFSNNSLGILSLKSNLLAGKVLFNSAFDNTFLQQIDISSNRLTGYLPTITRAPALTVLNLAANRLMGNIPSSFSRMSKLRTLNMNTNKLSGTLPANVLNTFTSMTSLDLSNNAFYGNISSSLNIPKLSTLNLAMNSFEGLFPTSLSKMPLTRLYLHVNKFSGNITSAMDPGYHHL